MTTLKCNFCIGNLKKDGKIFICEKCGKALRRDEVLEPALRITGSSNNSQIGKTDKSMLVGETQTQLTLDDILIFDNGKEHKIYEIFEYKSMKNIKSAMEHMQVYVVCDKLNEIMLENTVIYKKAKES